MGARRHSTEQIIVKLRPAEIEMVRGVKVRRLKALEQEDARLEKLPADPMLDSTILKETASGNF
jgi:hypothetical protein